MSDKGTDMNMLEMAEQELRNIVLPELKGEARYHALMIANAMGILQRQHASPTCDARDDAALCRDIRDATYPVGSVAFKDLAAALREDVQAQLKISNPKFTSRITSELNPSNKENCT